MIQAGQHFALPVSQTPAADQTLVVVIQQGCGCCAASMPFYRKLAQAVEQSPRQHLMAVLPVDVARGKRYLASNDIPIADVRQAALRSIDTPTPQPSSSSTATAPYSKSGLANSHRNMNNKVWKE